MGQTVHLGTTHGQRQMRKLQDDLAKLTTPRKLEPTIAKDLRRTVVPDLRRDIKASALANLPRRGGLAKRAAAKVRTTAIGSTRQGTVRIRTASKAFDVAGTDRGTLRHPVFARGDQTRDQWTWVSQPIRPGWWSRPVHAAEDDIVREVDRAVANLIKSLDLD